MDRRRYIQAALGSSIVSLAGCLGGGQGNNGSAGGNQGNNGSAGGNQGNNSSASGGNQTGGQSDWVREVTQEGGGAVVFSNLGDMSGDPATAEIITEAEEQIEPGVDPRVINPDNMIPFAQSRLQSQSQDVDAFTTYAESLWGQASQGYYEDLSGHLDHFDSLAEGVKDAASLPHSYMQDFPYRDGVYTAPIFDDMWLPFLNTRVMEQANVDPETNVETLQQFKDVAVEIKENTDIEYPVIFPYASPGEGGNIFKDLIVRHGGQIHDGSSWTFTSDPVRQAADYFLSLFREGLAPPGVTSISEGQATQQFFQGNAGVMINGSGNIVLAGKDLPIDEPAEEVSRLIIWPSAEGVSDAPTSNATPTGFSLSVFSPQKEATATFCNIACSPQAHKGQLIQEGNTALFPEVYEDSEVQEQVPYPDVFRQAVEGATAMQYPNTIEVRQLMYSVTQQAIGEDWSGQELVNRLQDQAP